jgi:hypothetical protein
MLYDEAMHVYTKETKRSDSQSLYPPATLQAKRCLRFRLKESSCHDQPVSQEHKIEGVKDAQ